jgi:hypothetical protein
MIELLNHILELVASFLLILRRIWRGKDTQKILDFDNSFIHRIQSLEDQWAGTVYQQDGPEGVPIEFPIRVIFEVLSLQKIRGKFWYYWNDTKTLLEAEGKAVDNRIIVLEFKDANKSVIRFGTFMFDFDHLGGSLEGYFVAYAAERKAIVTGSLMLDRVA